MAFNAKNERIELKPLKEVERLTAKDREEYFRNLHAVCQNRQTKRQTNKAMLALIAKVCPLLRGFDLVIEGTENLPNEDVIFVCNHSNTHDFFIVRETMHKLNKGITPLVALDGLSVFSRVVFHLSDATFIERTSKESKEKGVLDFCSKIQQGKSGFVFGEATWNMHPRKPMQNVKAGISEMSLITGKKVIPTIFEYVEVDKVCKKEKDLYSKCIVVFGKPIEITPDKSLFEQTANIQSVMEAMRTEIWERTGDSRLSGEVNVERYINHTYLKKYKAFGFRYNTRHESQFLLRKGEVIENEYFVDENGEFRPGLLEA